MARVTRGKRDPVGRSARSRRRVLSLASGLSEAASAQALARAEAAEEAARSQSTLLSLMAHEIRAPLGVVSGYLSMLEEGCLGSAPVSWNRPLGIVGEKVDLLSSLVEDVLSLARLDGDSLQPTPARVDLRQVVRASVARTTARVELIGASLVYEFPSEAVCASVDAIQVGWVLDNLINNALTYSADRPRVSVRLREFRGQAEVTVTDHGLGIAHDDQARIFDRFTRVTASTSGTGLGLAIARELAERNDGALELVRSELGRGSVFVVRFPAAPPPGVVGPTSGAGYRKTA